MAGPGLSYVLRPPLPPSPRVVCLFFPSIILPLSSIIPPPSRGGEQVFSSSSLLVFPFRVFSSQHTHTHARERERAGARTHIFPLLPPEDDDGVGVSSRGRERGSSP